MEYFWNIQCGFSIGTSIQVFHGSLRSRGGPPPSTAEGSESHPCPPRAGGLTRSPSSYVAPEVSIAAPQGLSLGCGLGGAALPQGAGSPSQQHRALALAVELGGWVAPGTWLPQGAGSRGRSGRGWRRGGWGSSLDSGDPHTVRPPLYLFPWVEGYISPMRTRRVPSPGR